jgi:hypothetical protein
MISIDMASLAMMRKAIDRKDEKDEILVDGVTTADVLTVLSVLSQTTTFPFEFYTFLSRAMSSFHTHLQQVTNDSFKSARAKRFLTKVKEADSWTLLKTHLHDISTLKVHKGYGRKDLERLDSTLKRIVSDIFNIPDSDVGESMCLIEKHTANIGALLAIDSEL